MDQFLASFTMSNFITIWALIGPIIGGLINHFWESDRLRTKWSNDKDKLKETQKHEMEKQQNDYKRLELDRIQQKMESAYSKFLGNGSDLILSKCQNPVAHVPDSQSFSAFNQAYQGLLLICSTRCGKSAVELRKAINEFITSHNIEALESVRLAEIKKLRASFLRQARDDLDDPIKRNSNPGITIEPVLKAGGFSLSDVDV